MSWRSSARRDLLPGIALPLDLLVDHQVLDPPGFIRSLQIELVMTLRRGDTAGTVDDFVSVESSKFPRFQQPLHSDVLNLQGFQWVVPLGPEPDAGIYKKSLRMRDFQAIDDKRLGR